MKIEGNGFFTYHAIHEKERRNIAMLELIRRSGAISRTDISKSTGVNIMSVSNYINNFIEKSIVLEKGHAASSGGRKPELVELNTKDNYCVGVEVCNDSMSAAVVDIGMNVVARKPLSRPGHRSQTTIVSNLIEDVVASAGISKSSVKGIGISACDIEMYPIRDEIEKKFGVPTFIGSEALCGAFAEKGLNKDADVKTFLYVYSDLGRGIVIDSDTCIGCVEMSERRPEVAGPASGKEDLSDAGKLKYLNPWGSDLGIVETAKREVERGVGTKIVSVSGGKVDSITEEVVINSARQNDETALNIVQCVALNLGLRIAYLINLFGPEAVVIGGGPEKAAEMMFPLINKMVGRLSLKKYIGAVKVMPSTLGSDSFCLGASALTIREIFLKA